MSNADSDIKALLAFAYCTDGHAIEGLTQLVPLFQTAEDEPSCITTCLVAFEGNQGISFLDTWLKVFKVDSFTDTGKLKWAEACNLKKELQVLMNAFIILDLHGDDKVQKKKVLTTYKNRIYSLLRQHGQPTFRLENGEVSIIVWITTVRPLLDSSILLLALFHPRLL